jgi:hypothetical protein
MRVFGPTIRQPALGRHSASVILLHGLGDTAEGWAPVGPQLKLVSRVWEGGLDGEACWPGLAVLSLSGATECSGSDAIRQQGLGVDQNRHWQQMPHTS